jgi:hypothetical protein
MIPISVYFGGKIQKGPYGMEYSCDPTFTFLGNLETRYEDVKNMIYLRLGISESQHSLNVTARYNTAGGNGYYFCLIPIREDDD